MKKTLKKTSSFTLVEMLIIITIVGILLPATFFIMSKILDQQLRIYKLVETKREGDYIFNFMRDSIRRDGKDLLAQTVGWTPICTLAGSNYKSLTNGQDVRFLTPTTPQRYFRFYQVGTDLFYDNNGIISQLNSTKLITDAGLFDLGCYKYLSSNPAIITLTFRVTYNDEFKNDPIRKTTLWYRTYIRIRNR
jgi:type II secretory pathway pseudopilin PulG